MTYCFFCFRIFNHSLRFKPWTIEAGYTKSRFNSLKKCLHFILIFSPFLITAQHESDSSNFRVGIFAGYYISGDATAEYYNGRDNNRLKNFINITQIENQIRESLDGYNFELAEYAQDMRYNNAASFELQASYLFGNNWNISLRFHSANLEAAGIFTLRVDRTNQGNPNTLDPYLEEAKISGKESRSHIDIGIGKEFVFENNLFILAEVGFDLNFVKVKENKMQIAGRTYSLPLYTNILNQQATPTTTIGTGIYLTCGAGFRFSNSIDFLIKTTYMNTKINLNDVAVNRLNIFIPSVGFSKVF